MAQKRSWVVSFKMGKVGVDQPHLIRSQMRMADKFRGIGPALDLSSQHPATCKYAILLCGHCPLLQESMYGGLFTTEGAARDAAIKLWNAKHPQGPSAEAHSPLAVPDGPVHRGTTQPQRGMIPGTQGRQGRKSASAQVHNSSFPQRLITRRYGKAL